MSSRGLFIVIEGCDRTGKSTQCKRLVDYLQQQCALQTMSVHFPVRETILGQVLEKYLKDKDVAQPSVVENRCTSTHPPGNVDSISPQALHLLFSANRWEMANEVRTCLSEGISFVVDRYAYSGVAFSTAKGLDREWCIHPDVGLPRPDVVLFLDMDVEMCTERGAYGEERYERVEFQRLVRDQFLALMSLEEQTNHVPGTGLSTRWYRIDASQPMECIELEIQHILQPWLSLLRETKLLPTIGNLWSS